MYRYEYFDNLIKIVISKTYNKYSKQIICVIKFLKTWKMLKIINDPNFLAKDYINVTTVNIWCTHYDA